MWRGSGGVKIHPTLWRLPEISPIFSLKGVSWQLEKKKASGYSFPPQNTGPAGSFQWQAGSCDQARVRLYGARLGMGGTNIQIRIMQESVWPTPRTPHRVQVCVRSTIDFLLIPGQMELLSTAPPYLINVPWYWLNMDTNTTWSPISTPQQCRTVPRHGGLYGRNEKPCL